MIGAALLIIIPSALTGTVMYFNSLGNENPFAYEKNFTGVIYYFSPGGVDSRTGQQTSGVLFIRTAPPNPHLLKVNLSEVSINDYSARENSMDLAIGNRWSIKGTAGPNNSLIMKSGMPMDASDGEITPARQLIENFLTTISDHNHLRVAFETMMSAAWKKPGSADKFKDKFGREPQFRPDFKAATIVPMAMKISERSSGHLTIYLDGSLLFQDNQCYSVGLVFENGAWKIDSFEPITNDVWNKQLK